MALRPVADKVHSRRWLAGAILVAPLLIFAGDGVSAGSVTDPCLGKWTGWGVNGGGPPWSIEMDVTSTAGASCGTIEYPSLGCGGTLDACGKNGERVTFKERYTHNPGTCAPAGIIEAVCGAEKMRWRWTGIEQVQTTLERVPMSPSTENPP
jgi:hypothetical protein